MLGVVSKASTIRAGQFNESATCVTGDAAASSASWVILICARWLWRMVGGEGLEPPTFSV